MGRGRRQLFLRPLHTLGGAGTIGLGLVRLVGIVRAVGPRQK